VDEQSFEAGFERGAAELVTYRVPGQNSH